MKKIVSLDGVDSTRINNGFIYLYRISSVNIDKVVLDKHLVKLEMTFEKNKVVTLSDETEVGTVTQKIAPDLIADISKRVDEIAVDFEMGEKYISSFDFKGIVEVHV